MSKAANACTQYTKGKNTSSAQNMLNAFINEVKAQKGKKINDADATLLIQFTQNAIKSMSVK